MSKRIMPEKLGAPPVKPKDSREDRLKSALKANMARRKAQARARSDASSEPKDGGTEQKDRP